MQSDGWRQCTEIFDEAVELSFEQRTAFLDQRCRGNTELRRNVELLLRSDESAGTFLEAPALEFASELLREGNPDALVGHHLGRYYIESVLGTGGMAVVYLARDQELGRRVALKVLPAPLLADPSQFERLKHEARSASALNHPNIVTIYEIGEAEGQHYIATEFMDGMTLRERIAGRPLARTEALDIAVQVARALSVAHAAGIIHRDIKPENIMLRPDGIVKVLDFGIAQFTSASLEMSSRKLIIGTVRYMSPEQAEGLPVDARTDIWSLGVILCEMLTGRAPFDGETTSAVLNAIKYDTPTLLPGSEARQLNAVVRRMLSHDRAMRYATAETVAAEVE